MKITNERSIKTSEKDLIDTIIKDIDWQAVEQIIRDKHHIGIKEKVRYHQGDIVVHNHQVAYRVNFDVTVPFSILLDRAGAFVSMNASQPGVENRADADEAKYAEDPSENRMLDEFNREMEALEALDEETPIELTEIVGNRSATTGSGSYGEASFLESAVNS